MKIPEFKHAAEDLLTLFEMTPDLVCIAGRDGFFINFNPAVPKTLGYTPEELFSRLIFTFIHPEDRDRTRTTRDDMLKGEALLNFQNRYITKTGQIVWLEWTSVFLPGKQIVFAIAKNITSAKQHELKVAERFRELQQLSTQFKNNIELDRKFVAMELHEQVAQLASSVRVDMDWISSNLESPPDQLKSRIARGIATSDLLVNTIRKISFSISPAMLDDLGLDAALEWYCKEFSMENNISCRYNSIYDEALLTPEIRLDFFRICQDVLDTVKHHAQAREVQVTIQELSNTVVLVITDNGIKIDPQKYAVSTGRLSIRERAASINATCILNYEEGKGNSVIVEWKK